MLIDWIEGTIKREDLLGTVAEIERYFVGCGWTLRDWGIMRYTASAAFLDTGRVLWNLERPEMGVHVILPASALKALGCDPVTVLRDLHEMGLVGTRCDLAADDFDGRLSMSEVRRKIVANEITCRAKVSDENNRLRGGSGKTLYLGQRTSETFFRIYDKSAEQADKKQGVFTFWIRAEMELKGKRAAAAMREIARHRSTWMDLARGWMLAYLDFKEPGPDSNKSRGISCAWWIAFLENAAKTRLVLDEVKKSVETVRRWVNKQVVPGLYMLGQTIGYSDLFEMILTGKGRMSERHEQMIDEYRQMATADVAAVAA